MKKVFIAFELLRIKQWVKNLYVFLPILFAGRLSLLTNEPLLLLFFSFCFAASSIYILNDLLDIEQDKLHLTKKKRPIPSGDISKKNALLALFISLAISLSVAYYSSPINILWVLSYIVLNVFYSFKLKHIAIIDVTCISIGFVLRVLAGGNVADVYVSHWMIIMIFLLSISLAFAKRRDDLVLSNGSLVRKSLDGYNIQFLDIAKSVTLSITLIAYIMYSISEEVMARIGSQKLYITSVFVFLGIMRYLQLTIVFEESGSPTKLLYKDRFLQLSIFLWILSFALIIYGSRI